MPDILSTIDEITIPKTASDLWEELYSDYSASSRMLAFYPDTTSKFRLLGNLYRGKRVYIAPDNHLEKIMSCNDLMRCLKGDVAFFINLAKNIASKSPQAKGNKGNMNSYGGNESDNRNVFLSIIDSISSMDKNGRKARDMLSELFRLVTSEGWQPCLFSNAYLIEQYGNKSTTGINKVFITCFNSNICRDIFRSLAATSKNEDEAKRKKISGMFAHDIIIERKGDKLKTQYGVKISPEAYFMPQDWVTHVLKRKLLDPRLLIKEINGKTVRNLSGFIYKIDKDCYASDEMMNGIRREIDDMKEVESLRSIEEHLNELPEEAFHPKSKSTIGSLEL